MFPFTRTRKSALQWSAQWVLFLGTLSVMRTAQATIFGQLVRHPGFSFDVIRAMGDATMRNASIALLVLSVTAAVLVALLVLLGVAMAICGLIFLARYFHVGRIVNESDLAARLDELGPDVRALLEHSPNFARTVADFFTHLARDVRDGVKVMKGD